jgi:hypothetical protein
MGEKERLERELNTKRNLLEEFEGVKRAEITKL